jgi:uncharacterized protein YjbI with pentapeptide repeats
MRFSLSRYTHVLIRATRGQAARVIWWLVASALVAAAAAAYGLALWRAPSWMHATGAQGRYDARVLVISVGGAAVVGIGLLYTARNFRLSRRGQAADRFAQALERLASDEMYVRIGGVHALEQVLRDSPGHHSDVLGVLRAFIHRRAPDRAQSLLSAATHLDTDLTDGLPERPEEDVQAALYALGRRPLRPERVIDLAGLYLAGARLNSTDLTDWDLSRANLSGAWFLNADLIGTWLIGADLSGARLSSADLSNAQFVDADLSEADLIYAKLSSTGFRGARLVGADLRYTNLRHADLGDADMTNAIVGIKPQWVPPGWTLDAATGRLQAAVGSEEQG